MAATASKYNNLLTPISVGSLLLDNRVIMAPTHEGLASVDGFTTPGFIDFYLKRARGGVSMAVIGAVTVNPRPAPTLLRISDDKFIPGLKELTGRIHSESGTKVCVQLLDLLKVAKGWIQNVNDVPPDQISRSIDYFVKAAIRAREAGFDAIELHAAHGYALSSFLSLRNRREDGYGKTSDGRLRIVSEIYNGIRAALGPDYPVGIRINGDEFIMDGNTLAQSRIIARKLAAIGFAYISVSAGNKHEDSPGRHPASSSPWAYPPVGGYSGYRGIPPAYMPEAVNVYLAADIRKTVRQAGYSTPIITAGRIPYPELAETILGEGQADIIALSRPLLRDPDWVVKARDGRGKEIKRCTYCNECMDRLLRDDPSLCVYLNE